MLNAYVEKCSEPETVGILVKFEGNGGASPTNKPFGSGVTVTWVSTGIYRLTFSDAQGQYVGCSAPGISDTAPAGVAGFTAHVDEDSYTAATRQLDVHVYNASQALADLPATSFLFMEPKFKRTAVKGA